MPTRKELMTGVSVCDFDVTTVRFTQGTGLTGIEVYDLLRDEYDIQIEFGDINNILAYISMVTASKTSSVWSVLWLISKDSTLEVEKDLIAGEYPARVGAVSAKAFLFRRSWL